MSLKKDKDGNIQWTEEQEEQIEMSSEARIRAARRLRAEDAREQQAKDCKAGKHADTDKDGKCSACGAKVEKQEPPKGGAKPIKW